MTESPPLVVATQLAYRYAGQAQLALEGVDLALYRGQAVGLLGPNGSGKSTLLGLLAGLREPQRGTVAFAGPQRPSIALVPQEYAFYPDLTCRENLAFFSGMLDLAGRQAQQCIETAIATCMLEEFVDRLARHCSGGVRRRLNLAIAVLQRPDVLLLDEPTAGVDPQSRAFLLERVREMTEGGTAILYATHYMEEVSQVCSRILLLDRGCVVIAGELDELLQGPGDRPPFSDLEELFMHHTHRRLRD